MHIARLNHSYKIASTSHDNITVYHNQQEAKNMYELIQRLIAFKYACKMNHWSTNNYSMHLLFDRLTEEVDDWADSVAESYFMARNEKSVFKPDLLVPKMVDKDLVSACKKIIEMCDKLQQDKDLDEGTKSLLGDIEAAFLGKLALAQLK